jgi:ATP-dependent Clp protease ATP-binding subunit ClpB
MGTDADKKTQRETIMGELDRHFRPEFLNRLDEIIIFHSLTREMIVDIVDIQLQRLERLLAERQITLELTPEAKDFLAERGFDPVFGARPLKRAIQRELQDSLAVSNLEGDIGDGDHVIVDFDPRDDALVFNAVTPEPIMA